MNRIIRWSGLGLFAGVIGLTIAITAWLAPWMLKKAIEDYGSEAWGAKIELKQAALQWSPFGFKLQQLQVTNPDKPMQNLVALETAELQLDITRALLGQWVIPQATIEGLSLYADRNSSGALSVKPTSKSTNQDAASSEGFMPELSLDLPDVAELIDTPELITQQRLKEWEQLWQQQQTQLKQLEHELPNQDTVKAYKKQWDALRKTKVDGVKDYEKQLKAAKKLKKQIDKDLKTVKRARRETEQGYQLLKQKLNQLRQAPGEDLAQLEQQYGLQSDTLDNLSKTLATGQLDDIANRIQQGYQALLKLFAGDGSKTAGKQAGSESDIKAKGRFYHYADSRDNADLIVYRLSASGTLNPGRMQLDLSHISPQPQQVSQPLTLKLRISDMAQIQRLSAEGIFDHRTPKQSKDQLDFRFNGAQLNSLDIWQQYQLQLDSAVGEGEGQIQFNQQGWLLKLASDWQQARFHADRSEQAGRIIADSLSHISDFNLNASIKQVDDDRDINIDSNLDRRLNQALAKQWKIQQQQWLKRVKRGLVKQIEQQLAEGDTSMLELDKVVNALAQDEKQLDTLVKSELESLKDKQEKRVEKALQKKLDKLFD